MKKTKLNRFDFELEHKDQRVDLRLSSGLLKALKAKARKLKIDRQKLIRRAIEEFLGK